MNIDVIILSNAKTQELMELTQSTIKSCLRSETEIGFNILVFEQMPGINYLSATTCHITEDFNYNRFMNYGIEQTDSPYVALCNNDLVFSEGWASNIIRAMKTFNLYSASPLCPDSTHKGSKIVDFGYNNRHHMSGWCIMCDRRLFKIIGRIDEDFPFWFADNAYAEQLKKFNVKHALVRNSVVKHLGSSTLNTLDPTTHNEITRGYIRKFIAKYPNNESARFFRKQLQA
jgi:GT2 family glycosyltransferase